MNDVLSAARKYHGLGWSIIPIRAGTKKPALRAWKRFQTERASNEQVQKWFGNGRDLGLAVVCGDVSGGLVVRDFDAMPAYERWAEANPALAKLPTVRTRRGRHVYCRADLEPIRRVSKTAGGILTFADGELRGGGYCVLPPSKHPDGGRYRWLVPLNGSVPEVDLAEAGLLPCNRDNGESRDNGDNGESRANRDNGECPAYSPYSPYSLFHSQPLIFERTLPTEIGERHKCAFRLARELKALPELTDAPAEACKQIVRQWYDRWPAALRDGFEGWWWDFAEGWGRVRYAAGTEPLAVLFAAAQATMEPLPESARDYDSPQVKLLVAFCRELQRANGDGPFYLSCRTAGELLGVDHVTASRWLRGLARDKLIVEVEKGSRDRRKASRYHYLGGSD